MTTREAEDAARIAQVRSAFRNLPIQDRDKILKDPSPSDDDPPLIAKAKAEVRTEREVSKRRR